MNKISAASSPDMQIRRAPLVSLAALLCLLLVWAISGLAFVQVVVGPVAGLLSATGLVAYWRFGKEWLLAVPAACFVVPMLHADSLADVFQLVATTALFMYAPIWMFGRQLSGLARRGHA